MSAEICFDIYLRSVVDDCLKRWQLNSLTDTVGQDSQRLQTEKPDYFDFGLMVQPIQPKQKRQSEHEEKEKIPPPISVLEICQYTTEHILLMGRPGVGKSNVLERLLLQEAEKARLLLQEAEKTCAESQAKIPVLIELREWKTSVIDLITAFFRKRRLRLSSAEIDDLLFDGRLLLLIDGVNELPSDQARQELITFRENNPEVSMIFATRVLSVGGDLGITKKLEMMSLNETQVRRFIEMKLPQNSEQMLNQLGDRLKEFGQTPLLLSMLCDVFEQNGRIPTNFGAIFRDFANVYDAKLKEKVQAFDNFGSWCSELLQQIAFAMMPQSNPQELRLTISKSEVINILHSFLAFHKNNSRDYAKRWIEDLLNFHLIQVKIIGISEEIEFRHQLLQEYYAAEYVWKLLQTNSLSDAKFQKNYLNYLDWTESLALMLEFVDNKDQALQLVRLALDVDLQLGARLAGAVKEEWQELTLNYLNQIIKSPLLKSLYLKLTRSKKAIPILLRLLESEDSEIRKNAATSIKEIADESMLPLLIKVMEQSDPQTCWIFADILGRIGNDTACPVLLNRIESSDENIRRSAAYALSKINSDLTLHYLIELLKHPDPNVRGSTAESLWNIHNEVVINELVLALEDDSPYVRAYAASSLGEIGSNLAVLPLIRCIDIDPDAIVRTRVAEALGKIGDKTAIPSLINALNDDGNQLYREAGESLHKICNESSIPLLLESLQHLNLNVREKAAYILGKFRDKKLVPILVEIALKDESFTVRSRAIYSLGEIGCQSSIPVLIELLKDKELNVRKSAAETLGEIASEIAIPALIEVIEQEHKYSFGCSPNAAFALSKINLEVSIPYLVKVLEGNDHGRTRVLLLDPIKLKDKRIIQSLIGIVKNMSSQDFIFSSDNGFYANLLGMIGGQETLSYLIEALSSAICRYKEIKDSMQKIDGNLNNENTQTIEMLTDRLPFVFFIWHTVPIVSELGGETVIPILRRILELNDFLDSGSIITSLGRIATPDLLNDFYNLSSALPEPSIALSSISDIQSRCKYYNYAIAQTPLQEESNNDIVLSKSQGNTTHMTIKNDLRGANFGGANIANLGGTVNEQKIVQKNEVQNQSLAEAAEEIQDLLVQLKLNEKATTEPEQQSLVARLIKAIQKTDNLRDMFLAGGLEVIKIVCPPLGIPIEMGKKLLEAAEKEKQA